MTDLDLITELRPDLPLATASELAPARGRLTDGIAAEVAGGGIRVLDDARRPEGTRRQWRIGPLRPSRRLGLAGLAATAAAAGVTVALTLPSQAGPTNAVPTGPARVNGEVATFLDAAASAALRRPGIVPRPDQFIYSEFVNREERMKWQVWRSVTGKRRGLVIINGGAPHWQAPCSLAQAEAGNCLPVMGYMPGFPTQPGQVLAYLIKLGEATRSDEPGARGPVQTKDTDLGLAIGTMLEEDYLLPAQRAAMYEFMARTPGVYPVPHAVDAIGRPGFGIGWNYMGIRIVIIFNPSTFTFLGCRVWPVHGGEGSNYYAGTALVETAIVNHVGQT